MCNSCRVRGYLGWSRPAVVGLCLLSLLFAPGCQEVVVDPPPDDTNGDTNGDAIEARIVAPTTDLGLSVLEEPVSVRYSVSESAANIRGFYVPVEDNGGDPPEEFFSADNLTPGENQTFSFDPRAAGVGFFHVGIAYTLDGAEEVAEGTAVIEVEGAPAPVFILPLEDVTEVEQGESLWISFDAGDPQGEVQWRLFILSETDSRNDPPHTVGTQLEVGIGNVGNHSLSTEDLAPGVYLLGVSATDSGYSILETVTRGDTSRIVTVPRVSVSTPEIRVLAAN